MHDPHMDNSLLQLMQLYFDGLYHCDTGLLGRVFDEDARYVTMAGGNYINIGRDEYFRIVRHRRPPAADNAPRTDEILSLSFAGENAAMVMAKCSIGRRHFTDLLTFIRRPAGWRLIAKVFDYIETPE